MQEMQEEKRALRAEVAAEQAETEQLRLLVRTCLLEITLILACPCVLRVLYIGSGIFLSSRLDPCYGVYFPAFLV